MTDPRKPIFDAVKAAGGTFPSDNAVALLDGVLTRLGVPKVAAVKHALNDLSAFFAAVRKITGPLDAIQVQIIQVMLVEAASWSPAWMAYGLATAWHESRLRPIEEIGKGRGLRYGSPGKHGQVAYGRGLVQLTWDYNYARADEELKLNGTLIADYAKALEPQIAVAILVRGMQEGWFTGKSLASYLPSERGTLEQFESARRIINGSDRAEMIAGYADQFQDALTVGGWV